MEGCSRRRNNTCQVLVGRKRELKAERRPVFLEQRGREHSVRENWGGAGQWGMSRRLPRL